MEFIPAKSILSSWQAEGWFGSHYTMNLYKGCCHGCIYCDSRSECYGIEDFDRVRIKENALETVGRELRSKRKKAVVMTGSMSDPYNPFEETYRLTRGALALLAQQGFGVAIATKSTLVTRDADILSRILAHSPAAVSLTITTAEDRLCRIIEPFAPPASARFAALTSLSAAGIPCGVLLMPLLPFINDTEDNLRAIVGKAQAAGASWVFAYPSLGVTLRQNQRGYFYNRLDAHFPGLRQRYMAAYGNQFLCMPPRHRELWQRFTQLCEDAGLLYQMEDIAAALQAPYAQEQLSMF